MCIIRITYYVYWHYKPHLKTGASRHFLPHRFCSSTVQVLFFCAKAQGDYCIMDCPGNARKQKKLREKEKENIYIYMEICKVEFITENRMTWQERKGEDGFSCSAFQASLQQVHSQVHWGVPPVITERSQGCSTRRFPKWSEKHHNLWDVLASFTSIQ